MKELVRFAKQNNFTVVYGKHIKFRKGDKTVIASMSPSCPFAYTKVRKDIERVIRESSAPDLH